MSYDIKRSTTREYFFLLLDSADHVAGKAAIAFGSVTGRYVLPGGSATAITLTGTGTPGTTDGYWREIDATNMKGVYGLTVASSTTDGEFAIVLKGTGFDDCRRLFQIQDSLTTDVYGRVGAPAGASIAADIDALPTATETATSVWANGTRTLTSFGTLVADIWDRLTSALTTAGSIGKLLVDNVNATIGSRSSHSAADVWSSATRTLSSFGALTTDTATAVWANGTRSLTTFGTLVADIWAAGTRTLSSYGSLTTDTAAAVWTNSTRTLTSLGASLVQEVWDRATSALTTAGSIGKWLLDNAGASGSGANACTFTATNSSTSALIEGAVISIRTGSQSGPLSNTVTTNSVGVATANLNNGTYYWAANLSGSYQQATGTLTVDGVETIAVSMTPLPSASTGTAQQNTVSGTFKTGIGTNLASDNRTLKVRLNKLCFITGGVTATQDQQSITIDSAGVWSGNFYRQVDCTPEDGTASTTVHYIFYLPDKTMSKKIIPNSATALYSALVDFS